MTQGSRKSVRERLRKRAVLRRGDVILARCFNDLHNRACLYARDYSSLDPIARRKAVGMINIAVRDAFSIFGDQEPIEPLRELHEAFMLCDSGIRPPLFAKDRKQFLEGQDFLAGRAGNKRRLRDEIGAFCLAVIHKLRHEHELSRTEACERVHKHSGVSVSALQDWLKRLRRDNAPLRPMQYGRHRQRLSFRFNLCLKRAKEKGLTANDMLLMFRTEPEVVRLLSLRMAEPPVQKATRWLAPKR
jgi:hypothetical protein